MFQGSFIFLFIAFALIVVVFAIVGLINAKKRREGMAAWAATRGWTYERETGTTSSTGSTVRPSAPAARVGPRTSCAGRTTAAR